MEPIVDTFSESATAIGMIHNSQKFSVDGWSLDLGFQPFGVGVNIGLNGTF